MSAMAQRERLNLLYGINFEDLRWLVNVEVSFA